jgi:uncharacterized protein
LPVENLKAHDFDLRDLTPGRRYDFFLDLGAEPDGTEVGFPVVVVNGTAPGKTLVVLAGVHGDEFEGIQAAHEIVEAVDPAHLSGRLIVVPVVHVAAYQSCQRLSPVDSLNLARTFPGAKEGTPTERIAYYVSEKVIANADFLIDLHSGGTDYLMPTMVGYDASESDCGRTSFAAAQQLGMPVIWGHRQLGPGRTLCEAARRDIPWLYTESAGGARVISAALDHYKRALWSLLQFLEIVPGTSTPISVEHHLLGDGDLDHSMFAETAGFFAARVDLLDQVEQHQLIGLIRDMFGKTLVEVRAPSAGVVAMLRANPVVSQGDAVCLLAQRL